MKNLLEKVEPLVEYYKISIELPIPKLIGLNSEIGSNSCPIFHVFSSCLTRAMRPLKSCVTAWKSLKPENKLTLSSNKIYFFKNAIWINFGGISDFCPFSFNSFGEKNKSGIQLTHALYRSIHNIFLVSRTRSYN